MIRLTRNLTNVSNGKFFAQIRRVRNGKEWHMQIRLSRTGELWRQAGIWDRKKDAIEEAKFLLSQPEFRNSEGESE